MAIRKVIQNKGSLSVCIPSEMCNLLGIVKGDRVSVEQMGAVGIVVRKDYPGGEVPVQAYRMETTKQVVDESMGRLRRFAGSIENSLVNNILLRVLGVAFEKGREAELRFSGPSYQAAGMVLTDPFLVEETKLLAAVNENRERSSRARKRPGRKGDRR